MTLSRLQRDYLTLYQEYHGRQITVLSFVYANRKVYLLMLLECAAFMAVSYFAFGSKALMFGGMICGAILLRDYKYLRRFIALWPALHEIIDWAALSTILGADGKSGSILRERSGPIGTIADAGVTESRDRSFLSTALVSVVAGISFGAGLAIFAIVGFWLCLPHGFFSTRETYVRFPPGLSVVEHSRVTGKPQFTIMGTVENVGPREWTEVSIEALIKIDGAQVNVCDTEIDGNLSIGERRAFEITCDEINGEKVPEHLEYEIHVTRASRS